MSRKLNWNREINIKNDTGVKEVVRNLIGRNSNKQVKQKNINHQLTDIDIVIDNNISNNSITDLLDNNSNNKSSISLNNELTNLIFEQSTILSNNAIVNKTEVSLIDSSSNSTDINLEDVKNELEIIQSENETSLQKPGIVEGVNLTNTLLNDSERKTKKLLGKTVKSKETSKRVISSLVAMEQWHTESEQKVYEVMYQETIAHRRKDRYFTGQGLCKKTGIASQTTVRSAIDGLIEKKSLEILTRKSGGRLAIRYRVYSPSEIIVRRRQAKIKIDEQSKQIL